MKIPSKIKTAVLAGALSAAPLANSNAQETHTDEIDKNKIEVVSDTTQNLSNKENNSNIIITKDKGADFDNDEENAPHDAKRGYHFAKNEAKFSNYERMIKRETNKKIANLSGDNIYQQEKELKIKERKELEEAKKEVKEKNKKYRKKHTEDKKSFKNTVKSLKNMFEKGSFLDNMFEKDLKKSKKAGLNVTYTEFKKEDDVLGTYNSNNNTMDIKEKTASFLSKEGVVIHEREHHSNELALTSQAVKLTSPRCQATESLVNEAFAHSKSAISENKLSGGENLNDFSKPDLEATIGRNIALFEYDEDDKGAQFYRNNQFKNIIDNYKKNKEEQDKLNVVGMELGIGDVKSEDFKYFCIKQYAKEHGLDYKNIVNSYEKSRDEYIKSGKGNLIDAAIGFSVEDEEKHINQIKEMHGLYKEGKTEDKIKHYVHAAVEKDAKELKEFKEKEAPFLNNKEPMIKSNDINHKPSEISDLLEVKYADKEKNDEYVKRKDTRINNYNEKKEKIEFSRNSAPNGSKGKVSVNARRKNLLNRINGKNNENTNNNTNNQQQIINRSRGVER